MLKFLYTLFAVLICLMVGKATQFLLGGLPGSLYGLLYFAALLSTGVLDDVQAGKVVARCIYFMPIVFLPVCVGIMRYFELFKNAGPQIVFIGVSTTLIGLVVVAYLSQRYVFTSAIDEDSEHTHD